MSLHGASITCTDVQSIDPYGELRNPHGVLGACANEILLGRIESVIEHCPTGEEFDSAAATVARALMLAVRKYPHRS
jgi:hypothetical protein